MALFFEHLPVAAHTCAAPSAVRSVDSGDANEDPWEPLNRRLYSVGMTLDHVVFRPLAMTYRRWLPTPVRERLAAAAGNLREPAIAINDTLQARPLLAAKTVLRFAANSTLGLGGAFDPAQSFGLSHHDNNFDRTLGRYHIGHGPYLYIPIAGPSSVRGVIAGAAEYVLDPLNWSLFANSGLVGASASGVAAVDLRVRADSQLSDLNQTSVDPYAALRSIYLQSKDNQFNASDAPTLQDFPDEGPNAAQELLPAGSKPASDGGAGGPSTPAAPIAGPTSLVP